MICVLGWIVVMHELQRVGKHAMIQFVHKGAGVVMVDLVYFVFCDLYFENFGLYEKIVSMKVA